MQPDTETDCPLWRRGLGMFYDAILLFAVLFLATALLLPFHGGTAFESGNIPYLIYLLAWGYLYFAWPWTHGGQTLGMRAWRIRAVDKAGKPPGWRYASLRYLASLLSWLLLGAGFAWALFDRRRRTLHDILSHTRLLVVRD